VWPYKKEEQELSNSFKKREKELYQKTREKRKGDIK
jgi:hypothetical protein